MSGYESPSVSPGSGPRGYAPPPGVRAPVPPGAAPGSHYYGPPGASGAAPGSYFGPPGASGAAPGSQFGPPGPSGALPGVGMPTPPGAPPPPPGPGVTPPFTAPPADRNRRGLWLGLGIGGLVLALCCVGGIVGFALLTVSASRQVEQDAVRVVGDYLAALQDRDYDAAYALLCSEVTKEQSKQEYVELQRLRPHITTYQVEKAQIGNAIVVPARVGLETGASETRRYELSQGFGQELRICGET